ncbi:MAG: glycosyltransferase family 2 protein [Treponemataceae bacterium]
MQSQPKISIIIPVHNTEQFLPECLESVINQTFKEIEIIVINDYSAGNCKEIVCTYQNLDDRIIFIDLPKNVGTLQTRLAGFARASGEFIQSLDSDDSLIPDACKIIYDSLSQTSADIAYMGVKRYIHPDKNKVDFQGEMFQPQKGILSSNQWIDNLTVKMNNCIWAYVIKKTLVDQLLQNIPRDFAITKYDDVVLVFLLSSFANGNLVAIEQRLYEYRIGTGVMHIKPSAQKIYENFRDAFLAADLTMRFLEKSAVYTTENKNRVDAYIKEYCIFPEYKNYFFSSKKVQQEVQSLIEKNNLQKSWQSHKDLFLQKNNMALLKAKNILIILSKKLGVQEMLKPLYYRIKGR